MYAQLRSLSAEISRIFFQNNCGDPMRGEFDKRVEKRPASKQYTGGKALQRLFYYLAGRDPSLVDEIIASRPLPKSARPRFGLTPWAKEAPILRTMKERIARPPPAEPPARPLAATIAAAAMALSASRAAASADAVKWQALGPTRIPNGQTSGTVLVDVIGRVACIAVDPSNSLHVLCGSAAGGIWESFDAGATWAPRTDDLPSLAIGAIAFDPNDPKTVYAGSGEGNSYSDRGVGVYKSTNGGTHWDVLCAEPFYQTGFFDLVVDPKQPMVLYAATTGGFFASRDGGLTWPVRRDVCCWNICLHPDGGDNAEILAAFADGLHMSTSGGALFTPVELSSLPSEPWVRLAVGRVAAVPDIAYVFGATGSRPHLWRREATTWTKIPDLPAINIKQADYDWYVAVPPDDPDRVVLGAIDAYRGCLSYPEWHWCNITTQAENSIHVDQHCLSFVPGDSRSFYAGNDGGVFRSSDNGRSWTALSAGLAITEIEYMAVSPNTCQWVMAGTQDNGTLLFSGAPVGDQIAQGDGGECGINPDSPDELYHTFFWDRDTGLLGIERSTGQDIKWTPLTLPKMSALFYPPVGVYGATIAVGASMLFASRDKGDQ
jgi:photosystem II stability/assembly factor-like uncharacterized protein